MDVPSYGAKVRQAIKPYINFAESIEGNPVAEVEVLTEPNGMIRNIRLLKSSGVSHWDQAVLVAVQKAERIPLDANGRVPPVLTLVFRAKDGS